MSAEQKVRELVEYRNSLFEKEGDQEILIDEYSEKIFDALFAHSDELSFECIMEAITSTGGGPSLLYDDNGRFAVLDEGMQRVCVDDHKGFGGVWIGTIESWKSTIRAALDFYLDELARRMNVGYKRKANVEKP